MSSLMPALLFCQCTRTFHDNRWHNCPLNCQCFIFCLPYFYNVHSSAHKFRLHKCFKWNWINCPDWKWKEIWFNCIKKRFVDKLKGNDLCVTLVIEICIGIFIVNPVQPKKWKWIFLFFFISGNSHIFGLDQKNTGYICALAQLFYR